MYDTMSYKKRQNSAIFVMELKIETGRNGKSNRFITSSQSGLRSNDSRKRLTRLRHNTNLTN